MTDCEKIHFAEAAESAELRYILSEMAKYPECDFSDFRRVYGSEQKLRCYAKNQKVREKFDLIDLILWTRGWFADNGKGCTAVIGISGGKDSTVAAAICVKALGKDRVIGVLMPRCCKAIHRKQHYWQIDK